MRLQGVDPGVAVCRAAGLRQSPRKHAAVTAVLCAAAAARTPRRRPAATPLAACWYSVPRPVPGLSSEYIALLRSGQRFDFYAASRWAAPAPDLVESVLVDQLRGAGCSRRCSTIRRRMRRPTTCAAKCAASRPTTPTGGSAPTVHVALDCTLGRHRDRALAREFHRARFGGRQPTTGSARSSRHSRPRPPRRSREMERHAAAALGAERPAPATP